MQIRAFERYIPLNDLGSRQYSIINNNDLDLTSSDLIYVITRTETNCGMQYAGQTGRSLKTRFREHFRKMKKPKKFDTFRRFSAIVF